MREDEDQTNRPLAGDTTVAGPQAAAAVTPHEPPVIAPGVLTSEQEALLGAVLNRIIPETGEMPGAGDLGIIATIDHTLAAYPSLRRLFCDGLVEIEVESARQFHAGFIGLDGERQDAVLQAVEYAFPAFFAALIDHTYRGYYTHPHVYQAIGYAHRPPQPLGHELPIFDPAMLEKQRQRAPFWRPIESDGESEFDNAEMTLTGGGMALRGPGTTWRRVSETRPVTLIAAVAVLAFIAFIGVYQSPRNLRVDIGGRDAGLNYNFFDRERSSSYTFRWTKETSSVIVPGVAGGDQRLSIGIAAPRPAGAPPAMVGIALDGRSLGQFPLAAAYQRLAVDVSLPWERRGNHTLVLTTTTFTENAPHPRMLGVIVDDVTVQPVRYPVWPPWIPLGAFVLDAVFILVILARFSRVVALIVTVVFICFVVGYQTVVRLPFGPIAGKPSIMLAVVWAFVVAVSAFKRTRMRERAMERDTVVG